MDQPRHRIPDHAVRRYAERSLGIITAATTEAGHIRELELRGVDVPAIRRRLQELATFGAAFGAPIVIADGVKVVIMKDHVPTVLCRKSSDQL